MAIVDIRETNEQEEEGAVPGAFHVPYAMLAESLKPRGLLHQAGVAKKLIFICTLGNAPQWQSSLRKRLALIGRVTFTVALQNGEPEIRAWLGSRRHLE